MKAAVYDLNGAPEVLRYADVPDPACAPDGIVIRVEAISIEGGDLVNRAGTAPPHPAYVGGFAAAGEIIEVGSSVTDRRVGQKVATVGLEGSHAELRAVPARRSWIVPDGLDVVKAAVVPIAFGTAYNCVVDRGAVRQGETVLVQGGAGGVGVAAIQFAKAAGARVSATVSGDDRAQRLKRLGLDDAIDHHRQDVAAEAKRLTGGRGVDLVVDPIGSTLDVSLAALRERGRLVFVGNAGRAPLKPDLWPALAGNMTLHGVFFGGRWDEPEVIASIDRILGDVAAGRIQVPVDRVFPLADAAAAHRHAEQGGRIGRTVMTP